MKKLVTAVLACGLFANSAVAATVEFKIENSICSKIADNKITTFEFPITEENGISYADATNFAKELGAEFKKNENILEIKKGDVCIIYTINSNIVKVNGEEKEIDAAAYITTEGDMIPVRFTAETLGYSVDYIKSLHNVVISDTKPIGRINGLEIGGDEYNLYYDIYYDNMVKTYGEEKSDEIKKMLNSQITDMLIQNYIIYSNAKSSGFDIVLDNLQTADNIKSLLNDFKMQNNITVLDSIVGSVFEKNFVAENYIRAVQMSVNVSEEEITEKYNNDYMCAKHILILTSSETGEAFTEEEKAKAQKKAEEIAGKLKSEDFDTLMQENSQDPGLESNPDGYVFTFGEMVSEFEDAVISLKEGEVSGVVESSYGYHIIKREKLPEINENIKEQIKNNISNEKYNEFLNGLLNSAEVIIYNEEIK